jgi:hypothetical protein
MACQAGLAQSTSSGGSGTPNAVACGSTCNQYYVSTTGSDSNDGLSLSTAWATINHAAAAITVGQTGTVVHVAPGVYNQTVVIQNTHPGSATARVTYISDSQWGAQFVSSGGQDRFVIENDAYFTDIVNFDVSGTACGGIGNGASYQRAVGNNVHNSATGCDTGPNGGSGIDDFGFFGTPTGNSMLANYVHDVGAVNASCQNHSNTSVQGLYESGSNAVIANNLVVNSCQCGIQLWHAATAATIVNNTITVAQQGILVGSGDSPCTSGTACLDDHTFVGNNIITGATRYGILSVGEDGGAIGTHNQYLNNLLYSNKTDFNASPSCASCITGENPSFVNNTGTSNGNYQLQSGSPAIGAGTSTNAPANHSTGATRTPPITIGAYQHQ